MITITVLVPTYRRPEDLKRCLEALKLQTRFPEEIIVVVRDTDEETWAFLASFIAEPLPLHIAKVTVPGQVAALNTGLKAAQGDIISITDDDAAPHPDWLERIETYFLSNPKIGGVGGRDWIRQSDRVDDQSRSNVGQVKWYGRVIGNHHLGVGAPRYVDVLKGANMSYRRVAIANKCFDERLRGNGSQINNDMAFSLALRRDGWALLYDPLVAVDHYAGQRFDEDQRNQFNYDARVNIVHNQTLALLEYLSPVQRIVFFVWAILVGTRGAPGIIQYFRLLPSQGHLAAAKCGASMRGRLLGLQTWQIAKD